MERAYFNRTAGKIGSTILNLKTDQIIYIHAEKVYKSTDAGLTWNLFGEFPSKTSALEISNSGNVLAGTNGSGNFYSGCTFIFVT
jgi:hypothetical protein